MTVSGGRYSRRHGTDCGDRRRHGRDGGRCPAGRRGPPGGGVRAYGDVRRCGAPLRAGRVRLRHRPRAAARARGPPRHVHQDRQGAAGGPGRAGPGRPVLPARLRGRYGGVVAERLPRGRRHGPGRGAGRRRGPALGRLPDPGPRGLGPHPQTPPGGAPVAQLVGAGRPGALSRGPAQEAAAHPAREHPRRDRHLGAARRTPHGPPGEPRPGIRPRSPHRTRERGRAAVHGARLRHLVCAGRHAGVGARGVRAVRGEAGRVRLRGRGDPNPGEGRAGGRSRARRGTSRALGSGEARWPTRTMSSRTWTR